MCLCDVKSYGAKLYNNNGQSIAPIVRNQVLQSHLTAIENSQPYKNFKAGRTGIFVGLSPDSDFTSINNYLASHSIRSGFLGKLAGLVYRIMEFFNKCWNGLSDETRALDVLCDLLEQEQSLTSGTYRGGVAEALSPQTRIEPKQVIKTTAEQMLETMLERYNTIVLGSVS